MATLSHAVLTGRYPESLERMAFTSDPAAFIAQHEKDYERFRLLGLSPPEIAKAVGSGHPVEAVYKWIGDLDVKLAASRFHESDAEWDAFVEAEIMKVR